MSTEIEKANTAFNALAGLKTANHTVITLPVMDPELTTHAGRPEVAETPPAAIDTFGFDLVFGADLPRVNACLARAQSGEQALGDFEINSTGGLLSYGMSGRLGTAEIMSGGSGEVIELAISITEGRFEYQEYVLDLAGTILAFETSLSFTEAGTGGQRSLQVDLAKLHFFEFAALPEDLRRYPEVPSLISMAMLDYLKDLNKTWAIAEITPGALAGEPDYDWLVPTQVAYAFTRGTADEESPPALGILCMTQDRAAEDLAAQVSAYALQAPAPASVLISPEILLGEVVMSSLPHAFSEAEPSDFAYHEETSTVTNTTEIPMDGISLRGTTYHPKVDVLSISLVGTQVHLYAHIKVHLGPGQTGLMSISQAYDLVFDQDQQTFVFGLAWQHLEQHLETTVGGEFLRDLIEIFSKAFSLVIGGTALVFKGILFTLSYCLVFGMNDAQLAKLIEKGQREDQPLEPLPIDVLTTKLKSVVHWNLPTATSSRLEDAQLRTSVRLSGFPAAD